MFWRFADPLLLRMRSRFEHLGIHTPSSMHEQLMNSRAIIGESTKLFSSSHVSAPSPEQISIGAYCYIMGEVLVVTKHGQCSIGHHCSLGIDSRIWTHESITIGNFVLIAHNVDIHDNNSHSLDWRDRREDAMDVFERKRGLDPTRVATVPVVIEDDVWIGAKSTIMKGVRLGRGSVVAAGSVVTRDVDSFTLVGGNPAREIRKLDP